MGFIYLNGAKRLLPDWAARVLKVAESKEASSGKAAEILINAHNFFLKLGISPQDRYTETMLKKTNLSVSAAQMFAELVGQQKVDSIVISDRLGPAEIERYLTTQVLSCVEIVDQRLSLGGRPESLRRFKKCVENIYSKLQTIIPKVKGVTFKQANQDQLGLLLELAQMAELGLLDSGVKSKLVPLLRRLADEGQRQSKSWPKDDQRWTAYMLILDLLITKVKQNGSSYVEDFVKAARKIDDLEVLEDRLSVVSRWARQFVSSEVSYVEDQRAMRAGYRMLHGELVDNTGDRDFAAIQRGDTNLIPKNIPSAQHPQTRVIERVEGYMQLMDELFAQQGSNVDASVVAGLVDIIDLAISRQIFKEALGLISFLSRVDGQSDLAQVKMAEFYVAQRDFRKASSFYAEAFAEKPGQELALVMVNLSRLFVPETRDEIESYVGLVEYLFKQGQTDLALAMVIQLYTPLYRSARGLVDRQQHRLALLVAGNFPSIAGVFHQHSLTARMGRFPFTYQDAQEVLIDHFGFFPEIRLREEAELAMADGAYSEAFSMYSQLFQREPSLELANRLLDLSAQVVPETKTEMEAYVAAARYLLENNQLAEGLALILRIYDRPFDGCSQPVRDARRATRQLVAVRTVQVRSLLGLDGDFDGDKALLPGRVDHTHQQALGQLAQFNLFEKERAIIKANADVSNGNWRTALATFDRLASRNISQQVFSLGLRIAGAMLEHNEVEDGLTLMTRLNNLRRQKWEAQFNDVLRSANDDIYAFSSQNESHFGLILMLTQGFGREDVRWRELDLKCHLENRNNDQIQKSLRAMREDHSGTVEATRAEILVHFFYGRVEQGLVMSVRLYERAPEAVKPLLEDHREQITRVVNAFTFGENVLCSGIAPEITEGQVAAIVETVLGIKGEGFKLERALGEVKAALERKDYQAAVAAYHRLLELDSSQGSAPRWEALRTLSSLMDLADNQSQEIISAVTRLRRSGLEVDLASHLDRAAQHLFAQGQVAEGLAVAYRMRDLDEERADKVVGGHGEAVQGLFRGQVDDNAPLARDLARVTCGEAKDWAKRLGVVEDSLADQAESHLAAGQYSEATRLFREAFAAATDLEEKEALAIQVLAAARELAPTDQLDAVEQLLEDGFELTPYLVGQIQRRYTDVINHQDVAAVEDLTRLTRPLSEASIQDAKFYKQLIKAAKRMLGNGAKAKALRLLVSTHGILLAQTTEGLDARSFEKRGFVEVLRQQRDELEGQLLAQAKVSPEEFDYQLAAMMTDLFGGTSTPKWHLLELRLFVAGNKWTEAQALLNSLPDAQKTKPRELFWQGRIHDEQDQLEQAADCYRQALAKSPTGVGNGDFTELRDHCEARLAELRPDPLIKAMELALAGNVDGALEGLSVPPAELAARLEKEGQEVPALQVYLRAYDPKQPLQSADKLLDLSAGSTPEQQLDVLERLVLGLKEGERS